MAESVRELRLNEKRRICLSRDRWVDHPPRLDSSGILVNPVLNLFGDVGSMPAGGKRLQYRG
jgi:hypothetical protein